jgi:hypothetical protein
LFFSFFIWRCFQEISRDSQISKDPQRSSRDSQRSLEIPKER